MDLSDIPQTLMDLWYILLDHSIKWIPKIIQFLEINDSDFKWDEVECLFMVIDDSRELVIGKLESQTCVPVVDVK